MAKRKKKSNKALKQFVQEFNNYGSQHSSGNGSGKTQMEQLGGFYSKNPYSIDDQWNSLSFLKARDTSPIKPTVTLPEVNGDLEQPQQPTAADGFKDYLNGLGTKKNSFGSLPGLPDISTIPQKNKDTFGSVPTENERDTLDDAAAETADQRPYGEFRDWLGTLGEKHFKLPDTKQFDTLQQELERNGIRMGSLRGNAPAQGLMRGVSVNTLGRNLNGEKTGNEYADEYQNMMQNMQDRQTGRKEKGAGVAEDFSADLSTNKINGQEHQYTQEENDVIRLVTGQADAGQHLFVAGANQDTEARQMQSADFAQGAMRTRERMIKEGTLYGQTGNYNDMNPEQLREAKNVYGGQRAAANVTDAMLGSLKQEDEEVQRADALMALYPSQKDLGWDNQAYDSRKERARNDLINLFHDNTAFTTGMDPETARARVWELLGVGSYTEVTKEMTPEEKAAFDEKIDKAIFGGFTNTTGEQRHNAQSRERTAAGEIKKIDQVQKNRDAYAQSMGMGIGTNAGLAAIAGISGEEYRTGYVPEADVYDHSNDIYPAGWTDEQIARQQEATGPNFMLKEVEYKEGWYKLNADDIYSYANHGMLWQSAEADAEKMGRDHRITDMFGYAELMNDEELAVFNELYLNGNKDQAMAYFDGLRPTLNERGSYFEFLRHKEIATQTPGLSSVGTFFATAMQPGEALGTLVKGLMGDNSVKDGNSAHYAASRFKNNIRGIIASNIDDEFLQTLYTSGMSMGDNFVNAFITGGLAGTGWQEKVVLGLFATQAFESSMQQNLVETNGDWGQSLMLSTMDAVIETITEIWSVENLLSNPHNLITFFAKLGISEGSEEFAGNILRPAFQRILMGTDEIEQDADQIFNNGGYTNDQGEFVQVNSYDEAYRIAFGKYTHETIKEGLAGAASGILGGGVKGSTYYANRYAANRSVGRNILAYQSNGQQIQQNNEQESQQRNAQQDRTQGIQELIGQGMAQEEGSESRKLAEKIQQRMEQGKKVSNAKVGQLATMLQQGMQEQLSTQARQSTEASIAEELQNKGLSEEDANRKASLVAEALSNEDGIDGLKKADRLELQQSTESMEILDDLSGEEESELSKKIGQRIQDDTQGTRESMAKLNRVAFTDNETVNRLNSQESVKENAGEMLATDEYVNDHVENKEERTGAANEIIVDDRYVTPESMELVAETDEEKNARKKAARKNGEQGTSLPDLKLKMTVNGQEQTVSLSQVKSQNFTVATILQQAQTNSGLYSTRFVNKVLQENAAGKIENVGAFMRDAYVIRMNSALGLELPGTISMNTETARDLWLDSVKEEQELRDKDLEQQNSRGAGKGVVTYNGVEFGTKAWDRMMEDKNNGLDRQTRDRMDAIGRIAKASGMVLQFKTSEQIAREQKQLRLLNGSKESAEVTEKEIENERAMQGSEHKTGITVNIDAWHNMDTKSGQHMMVTFGHEMTHWLQRNSRQGYNQLQRYVIDQLRANNVNLGAVIEAKINEYAGYGQELNIHDAVSEIVAQSCDQILSNEAIAKHIQESKPGLFNQIKDFVKDLVSRVKKATSGMSTQASYFSEKFLQNTNEMAKVWLGAYDEAISGKLAEIEANTPTAEKVKENAQRLSVAQFDNAYMQAVANGDRKAMRAIVDETAKRNNFNGEHAYHGTGDFGFTKFNMPASQGQIFVAYSRSLAATYTSKDEVRPIVEGNFDTISNEELAEVAHQQNLSARLLEMGEDLPETIRYNSETGEFEAVYSVEDDFGAVSTEEEVVPISREDLLESVKEGQKALNERGFGGGISGIYDFYTRPGNQYVVDAKGAAWKNITVDWSDTPVKTRDIAVWAKEQGYDSVRINNVVDSGEFLRNEEGAKPGDIGIFFNETDVKSADLITYDDNGEIIKPSERFTDESRDLRHSLASKEARDYMSNWAKWHVSSLMTEQQKILQKYGINTRNVNTDSELKFSETSLGGIVLDAETLKSISKKDLKLLQNMEREAEKWRNKQVEYMGLDENDLGVKYWQAWKMGSVDEMEQILMQKMQDVGGIIPFKAPELYTGQRNMQIANLIKENNPEAIQIAAAEMAQLVPKNAVLIPMPPHTGKVTDTTDTMVLAKAISELTKRPVLTALESDEHERRKENKGTTAEDLGFRQTAEIPEGMIPYFIDNMIASGVTAQAAHDAIGHGITLAFAKGTRGGLEGMKYATPTFLESYGKQYGQWLIPLDARIDNETSAQGVKAAKYSMAQMNSDYMEAVKSGDTETQQKLVFEAGARAGYTIRAFHGTARGDRVGNVFRKDRATSGPMAYFTDNRNIAENYAKGKQDTSIAYDEEYGDYANQFRIKTKNGKTVPVSDLWKTLSFAERQKITEKAKHITLDDEAENIIYDENVEYGVGNFTDYERKLNGWNSIRTLIDGWLNGGTLFGREGDFLKVLELAGIKDVIWNDPDAKHEKVYDTLLKIQNPFNTSEAYTTEFVDGLESWWAEQDQDAYDTESASADYWDKRNISVEDWIDRARYDIENKATNNWTQIPDAVSDYLKSLGYDGIQDNGGKSGGEGHTVWIPFSPEQIKSAEAITYDDDGNVIPLDERFNQGSNDIRYAYAGRDPSTGRSVYISSFEKGTDAVTKGKHIISLIQNVWQHKPIELTVYDNNSGRKITAKYDPDFDDRQLDKNFDKRKARMTPAGKMAFGIDRGSKTERRVAINLADDYHDILQEAHYYNTEKNKSIKHSDVNLWHYFVDDIYYVEQGSDEALPYQIEIDIQEKSNGSFVYVYYAKQLSKQGKKLSVMGIAPVNTGENSDESASASKGSISQGITNDNPRNSYASRGGSIDVQTWMLGMTESNFETEGEKRLFRAFKDLKMQIDVTQMKNQGYLATIRRLNGKQNLTYDEREQLRKAKINLETGTAKLERLEDERNRITDSEGWAGMMFRQSRIIQDYASGKTHAQVMKTIQDLTNEIQKTRGELQRNAERLKTMAETQAVRTMKSYLNKTSLKSAAQNLRKEYGSRMSKGAVEARLASISLKLASGENVMDDVTSLAQELSEKIPGYGSEALERMKGTTFIIGKGQMEELKANHQTLKDLRARLRGSGIKVRALTAEEMKRGGNGNLESQWEEFRNYDQSLPELGYEKDQLENLVSWVESQMELNRGGSQYGLDLNSMMADIVASAGTVSSYIVEDPKAKAQIDSLMKDVRDITARAESSAAALEAMDDRFRELELAGVKAKGWTSVLQRDVKVAIQYYNETAKQAVQTERKKLKETIIAQLKSENAQKLMKQSQKYEEKIANDKKTRQIRADNDHIKKQIETNVKRVSRMMTEETDLRNIPEQAKPLARKLVELLVRHDRFADRGMRITKTTKENMERITELLTKWDLQDGRFNPDRDLNFLVVGEGEYADETVMMAAQQALIDIESGLKDYDRSGGHGLVTMRDWNEALQRVRDGVNTIYLIIQKTRNVEIEGRQVLATDAAIDAAEEMGKSRFKGELVSKTGKAAKTGNMMDSIFLHGNATPVYFIKNLRNKVISQLFNGIKKGENRYGLETKKYQGKMAEIAAKHRYETWDQNKAHKITLGNGKTVSMTTENLMYLYATWKREQNTTTPEQSKHLTTGGMYLEEAADVKGVQRQKVSQKAIRLTEADINSMISQLTEEQKNYADDVVRLMSTDLAALGNEASMQMHGIKKFKESFYFPFKVWTGVQNVSSDAGSKGQADHRAAHPGFSNRRINNANNAIVIGDFTKTAAEHIIGMINYSTMAPAIENMQKVLNASLKVGEGETQTTRKLYAAFQEAYGTQATKYMKDMMQDLNGGAVRDNTLTLQDFLLRVFKKNAVAGSMSVAAQQPLSYLRAALRIQNKYLAKALSPKYWKGSYEEMINHSGVAVIKDIGKFDMGMGQSGAEFILPERREDNKLKKVGQQISEKSTILPELADRMTWTRMWTACKLEQMDLHKDMDFRSDEFLDIVAERFNDLMRETQVYDSVLVKSKNMRSTDKVMKMATSFMAEPTLTANVLADAWLNRDQTGKKAVAVALTNFGLSAMLQAAVKGLFSAGRTPDKDKTLLENWINKFMYSFISEINPLNLLPYYNDVVEALTKGELKDDTFGVIGKVYAIQKTIRGIFEGKETVPYRVVEDSVGQMLQLATGVPLKNIMRDLRATANILTGGRIKELTGGEYAQRGSNWNVIKYSAIDQLNSNDLWGMMNAWLGDAGYKTSTDAYYKRIYNAQKAGDTKGAEEMKEYLLLGKGVKEETLQENLATLTKKDEDLTEAEKSNALFDEGLGGAGSYALSQVKKGKMSEEDALSVLRKEKPDADVNDLWWRVDRAAYQRDTGKQVGSSAKNYRLVDALDSNKSNSIVAEVKTMQEHGVSNSGIQSMITKACKEKYLAADENGKIKIRNAATIALKAIGLTADQANKLINGWKPAKKKK